MKTHIRILPVIYSLSTNLQHTIKKCKFWLLFNADHGQWIYLLKRVLWCHNSRILNYNDGENKIKINDAVFSNTEEINYKRFFTDIWNIIC